MDAALHQGMNESWIKWMAVRSGQVLVGWGNEGQRAGKRPAEILKIVGGTVYCIKTNQNGEPVHPLYQPGSSQLREYVREVKK